MQGSSARGLCKGVMQGCYVRVQACHAWLLCKAARGKCKEAMQGGCARVQGCHAWVLCKARGKCKEAMQGGKHFFCFKHLYIRLFFRHTICSCSICDFYLILGLGLYVYMYVLGWTKGHCEPLTLTPTLNTWLQGGLRDITDDVKRTNQSGVTGFNGEYIRSGGFKGVWCQVRRF